MTNSIGHSGRCGIEKSRRLWLAVESDRAGVAYLGIEIAALLHEAADREPEAVGQGEVVDRLRERYVLGVRVQGADVNALMPWPSGPPPSGCKTSTTITRTALGALVTPPPPPPPPLASPRLQCYAGS